MNDMTKSDVEIGKHSRITLGVMWLILGVVLSGAIAGVGMYDGVCARIDRLQNSQLTRTDNLTWILQLQKENPSLNVPLPQWTKPDSTALGRTFVQSSNHTIAAMVNTP